MTPKLIAGLLVFLLGAPVAEASVTRLQIDRREVVLNGQPFGAAGPYEKLAGKVHFALDPSLPQNRGIVDLALAPKNAQGLVEFWADFYLLKPVDPGRGNGRLFYEAGNRGTKRILPVFQDGSNSNDPTSAQEFGNGALMRQGFTLLWMGWQWDVPEGRMRMEIPIATHNGQPITGWVRGNFIPGANLSSALIADRGHQPYPVVDPDSAEHRLLVRTLPTDPPREISRATWRFTGSGTVTVDRGFEAGLIYDVVYRARDPRVIGVGLSGTRDLVSFFKHAIIPILGLIGNIILVLTIFTVLLSVESDFTTHTGEYLALVLLAASGMMFLVSAEDVLMIFIALELTSLSLYILTAFNKRDVKSAVGLSALMHRKRRQIFVETDFQRIFRRAHRRRRGKKRGRDCNEPALHGFLRLDTKAQISVIS